MSDFINPYHFVPPLAKPVSPIGRDSVSRTLVQIPPTGAPFQPEAPELLHDRYQKLPGQPETFSGRIQCTLKTVSPCVFGNQHRKVVVNGHETTVVENFQIDQKPAIPGTALKGMLSTLVELASGSAMRVLGNHAMSIRSSMRQSRSAVGMIIERTVQEGSRTVSKRMLLPLTLPNFSWDRGKFTPVGCSGTNAVWHQLIQQRSSLKTMPVYVARNGPESLCFHPQFPVVELPDTYCSHMTWDARCQQPSNQQPAGNSFTKGNGPLLLRPVKRTGDPLPKPIRRPDQNPGTFPGILRSLAAPDGNKDSTFDLFIPIAPCWISAQNTFDFLAVDQKLLLDAEAACCNFDALVTHPLSTATKERSATELRGQSKFQLLDKLRTATVPPQLKQGALVFFTPSASGRAVDSLSISAIWREGVRWLWNEATGDYSLLHHPDQRPMSPTRQKVTMAEKLFGWVLEGISDQDEQPQDGLPNGYKGRVTVSDAQSETLLQDAQLQNNDRQQLRELQGYYPMPILSAPKLPCPEFYFRGGSQQIRQELINSVVDNQSPIRMQGWKFYVVDRSTVGNDQPQRWKTQNPTGDLKQKSWVRPVKCGIQFSFQVRFNQLTLEEYQLLCYALKPAAQYYHRLGYGKPFGLGVVQLETGSAELGDYSMRYRDARDLLTTSVAWTADSRTVAQRAEQFAHIIKDHHNRIVAAGQAQKTDVSYPVMPGQNAETKLYQWFVQNRERNGEVKQRLRPLNNQGLDQNGQIQPLKK